MKFEKIDLYSYFGIKKPSGANGILTTYVLDEFNFCPNRLRPAMLVLPGGGYKNLTKRESEPIAIAYNQQGFNSYLLEYTCVPNGRFPTQFIESAMAMAYIRENAEIDHTDAEHVCAIGFSAGGHLCASLGTMFDDKVIKDVLGDRKVRPDGIILSYAVISAGEYIHQGSFDNLCGDDSELIRSLSIEKKVNKNSSPAFIWTTYEDDCVRFENSLLMAMAYGKFNVPVELHVFEHGWHGLSLATCATVSEYPYVKSWFSLSLNWLKEKGFIENKF